MSRSFSQGMTELSSPAGPDQVSNAPIASYLAHRPHRRSIASPGPTRTPVRVFHASRTARTGSSVAFTVRCAGETQVRDRGFTAAPVLTQSTVAPIPERELSNRIFKLVGGKVRPQTVCEQELRIGEFPLIPRGVPFHEGHHEKTEILLPHLSRTEGVCEDVASWLWFGPQQGTALLQPRQLAQASGP